MTDEETARRFLFKQLDPLLQSYVEREADYRENHTGYLPVEIEKTLIADWVLAFLGVLPQFGPSKLQMQELVTRIKAEIPIPLRWEVWERDNFTCQACGSRRNLTIDHIVAESKGGPTELNNLQTLCKRCNSVKGVR